MNMRSIAAAALAASPIACSVDYGQTRSSFQTKSREKTLEEPRDAAGKPAREEQRGADEMVLQDPSGKLVYTGIDFVPES
jgi:hypothetical protein